MNSGICVCVFLAVLSSGCIGGLINGSDNDSPIGSELKQSVAMHQRQIREAQSTDKVKAFQNSKQRANLGALLTQYLQQVRKGELHQLQGSLGRGTLVGNKLQNLDPSHRISDRDYVGWMDFGRRSAEEYEYSA
ncbi:cholecystokinin-like isoform X1 [Heterodontus francisci]|uniref:cholecystokinin-like isoform X1 n=1 Tax=Heterodontus francisci TaxID=7792 RepID=UPI00355C8268